MVTNFTAPDKETGQCFLFHHEVVTFFHEFGHLMHHVCSHTETALFSGTAVETDFVECPSQMLENWVWNVDGLKALLGTNDDPIPKDLLASLINSRIANAGLFYSRQILLASFDQAIHTTNWEEKFGSHVCDAHPDAAWDDIRKAVETAVISASK
ncbi:unnamed protein product, partial [Schistosoma curassoni]|uniref:Peptidase_M3 domain-containing protein n=1 Tax=Schistosoma curassoni TaxID=6186 RepID=A0A183JMN7_9TREM